MPLPRFPSIDAAFTYMEARTIAWTSAHYIAQLVPNIEQEVVVQALDAAVTQGRVTCRYAIRCPQCHTTIRVQSDEDVGVVSCEPCDYRYNSDDLPNTTRLPPVTESLYSFLASPDEGRESYAKAE